MATYTQHWTLESPSGQTKNSKSYSASELVEIDEPVANGQTDLQVNVSFDISAVKAFEISSDQDLTVEGNDSVGAAGTVALKANVPYRWNTDWYDTFKFTADITSLFLTNASGSTANFKLRCIYDATP